MLYVALCTLLAELCESSLAALYLDQLVLPDELLRVASHILFCFTQRDAEIPHVGPLFGNCSKLAVGNSELL